MQTALRTWHSERRAAPRSVLCHRSSILSPESPVPRPVFADHLKAPREGAEARVARAIHRRWLASYAGLRVTAQRALLSIFNAQRDKIIQALNRIGLPNGTPGHREHGERGEDKDFLSDLCGLCGSTQYKAFDDWITEILLSMEPEEGRLVLRGKILIRDGLGLGGQQAIEESGQSSPFSLEAPAVRRRLERQTVRVRHINETTRGLVRDALVDGLDAGETLTEVGQRVASAMDIQAGRRSWTIAQTEMHEAVAGGRHEGLKQAGIEAKSWLTSGRGPVPNGPTRLSHWACEQKTKDDPIPIADKFELIDEHGEVHECDHPGAGNLPPGERINCSCVEIARTEAGGGGKSVSLDRIHTRQDTTWETWRRRARFAGSELVANR